MALRAHLCYPTQSALPHSCHRSSRCNLPKKAEAYYIVTRECEIECCWKSCSVHMQAKAMCLSCTNKAHCAQAYWSLCTIAQSTTMLTLVPSRCGCTLRQHYSYEHSTNSSPLTVITKYDNRISLVAVVYQAYQVARIAPWSPIQQISKQPTHHHITYWLRIFLHHHITTPRLSTIPLPTPQHTN